MPFLRERACFPATCLLRDHFEPNFDTIGELVAVIETTEEKTSTAWFLMSDFDGKRGAKSFLLPSLAFCGFTNAWTDDKYQSWSLAQR